MVAEKTRKRSVRSKSEASVSSKPIRSKLTTKSKTIESKLATKSKTVGSKSTTKPGLGGAKLAAKPKPVRSKSTAKPKFIKPKTVAKPKFKPKYERGSKPEPRYYDGEKYIRVDFQKIPHVETSDWYLDLAFGSAKTIADASRSRFKGSNLSRLAKSRRVETEKIDKIQHALCKHFSKILLGFPNVGDLPKFYQELVKCTVEYVEFKKSLGSIKWTIEKIDFFSRLYRGKIYATREMDMINAHRKEYYGRISSLLKQVNKFLKFLSQARLVMRTYPTLDLSLKTVAIFGFPNVGKTTLLHKLTGSKAEIQSYAFTTKGLNAGYIKKGYRKLQLVDTPGTLDRFEKMNEIEIQAELVVANCASYIIYVFDLTEPFPIKDQLKLYSKLQADLRHNKFDLCNSCKDNLFVYVSKGDLLDSDVLESFISKNKLKNAFFDSNKLFEKLNLLF
ncbi:GTP-binding protein [Candidatus Woesearchaeota archaeon]|jgi:nucleolar GTP-binding protein|nr:GTP-binding protein [Candidatus Woesearchaeota archaeon]